MSDTYATATINNLLHGSLGSADHLLQHDQHHTTETAETPPYDALTTQNMQVTYPASTVTPQAIPPISAIGDECIYVYVIIAVDDSVNDQLWNHLNTSLFVTQPVTEEEMNQSNAQNSFACFQQIVEIPTQNSKQFREISARIFIKNYIHHTHKRVLFQLFLQVSNNNLPMSTSSDLLWDKLDVVSFIQLPSTGQILRPIGRELLYDEVFSTSTEGLFLGSFMIHDTQLYHHLPTEETLQLQEEGQYNGFVSPTMDIMPEEVVIVDKKDLILETNGARGGRPSHRLTGQLLMSRPQVEKILEIRARWHGLSPRQRRDNVSAKDFFIFITLNRDETAECLGVCATWLKDAIRSHGVIEWPGRPLRKPGAMLQTLKENMNSIKAALQFSHPSVGETDRLMEEIRVIERKIEAVLEERISIVRGRTTTEYFEGFMQADGKAILNPDWNALPPFPTSARHRVQTDMALL
ncbi:unnamed protein product [Agarophyton chilense]